jgi:hypothetical protein
MVSDQDLQTQIVDVIAEELGILATVIFSEILEELGIEAAELTRFHAGRFVRVLDARLPPDLANRQQIVREVGQLLIQAR